MVLILGPHMSIGDGIDYAIRQVKNMKGNAMQIFTGPPHSFELGEAMTLTDEKLHKIKEYREKENVEIVIHSKYILNFSKPLIPKNKIFLVRFVQDLNFAKKIGALGVVIHFGTATNEMKISEAVKNMAASLTSCLEHADTNVTPILETSSGEGSYIGRTIESMNMVYRKLSLSHQKRIKFCIDTCHIFVAGYAIQKPGGFLKYIKNFERIIGKNKIGIIHLNDSRTPYAGKNDRHEEIAKGYLFNPDLGGSLEALREIITYADKNNIPMILETHQNFPEQIQFIYKIMNVKSGGTDKNLRNDLIERFTELMDIHKALGNIHQFHAYKNVVNQLKLSDRKIRVGKNVANLEGFGKGILSKIDEYAETGRMKVLNSLKADNNVMALNDLQKVYGIGPAFAKKLIKQNIYTVDELQKAVDNKVIALNDNQLIGLKYFDDLNTTIDKKDALKVVNYLKKILKKNILLMGGYRLGKTSGKDIDLLVIDKDDTGEVLKKLEDKKVVKAVLEKGNSSLTILVKVPDYKRVVHIDLRFTSKKTLPFYTLYFGSGENFSRKIRQIAKDKGYKLNENGLTNLKTDKVHLFKSEEEIFEFLGLEYVSPNKRLIYKW